MPLRASGPDGTSRRWTLKEVIQGKPLGHPSHAMLVHFPIGLTFAAVGFDLVSRLDGFDVAPQVGTYALVAGQLMTFPVVFTGFVDWLGMVRGSSKRTVATKHFVLQAIASALFSILLAMRWGNDAVASARPSWIIVGAIAIAISSVGQWFGGELVYAMGMRVSTRRKPTTG